MKPGPNARHWIMLCVMLAVFTFCFAATRRFTSAEYSEFLTSFRYLRQLKSNLVEDALRMRTGLLLSYDSISEISDEMTKALNQLYDCLNATSLPNKSTVLAAFDEVRKRMTADLEEIDRFKSLNSIVRNSLRYMPTVYEEARKKSNSQETRILIDRVYEDTLRYSVQPDSDLRVQLETDRARLAALAKGKAPKNIGIFLTHVHHVLENGSSIDKVLSNVTGRTSSGVFDLLSRVYHEGYDQAMTVRARYQVLMYTLSVLVLAYLGFVLTKLRDAFKSLRTINVQLKVKVDEIAELHARAENKVSLGQIESNQLRDSIKALERVLGVIGHELRTPLASLRAMSEFMVTSDDRYTPEFGEFLTAMPQQVERMGQDVNDLLEVARLNSGCAKWTWTEFDVSEVCIAAIDSIRPLVDGARIRVTMDLVPSDLKMKGDRAALRRLLTNLLNNSYKNTTEGSINLRVRALYDGQVLFQVCDTGVGMSPKVGRHLGVAFALNEGMVGDQHVKGSGLGLAICKGIVAAHHGSISVESSVGYGTIVSVTLHAELTGPAPSDSAVEVKYMEKVPEISLQADGGC